jgi:putative transposase
MRPAVGRQLVDYLRGTWQVSIRRSCAVLLFRRSTYHYRSRRPSQAALRKRIREIAETRVRYGYRRVHVLLQREGWDVNHKRVYRLYVEEGLQIRNKRPKRKVSAKLREGRKAPAVPNEVWAMDFLSDQLFDGSKIRILTIVDAFSKLSPSIDVRQRYRGSDVVNTLECVTAVYGLPKSIRVDQGPEFISKDLDLWAWSKGVTLDFSRPGKPTDNAFVESFNGKVRAECIDQNWFLSLDDARSKCEAYRRDYNEERPHSAIGNKTPMELVKSVGQPSHPTA